MLALCTACGAGQQQRVAEGGLSLEQATARLDRGMAEHGYSRMGGLAHMVAPGEGRVVAHVLAASGGHCYEAIALPVGESEFSMEVRGPADAVVVSANTGEHPTAHFCTASAARFRFLVSSEDASREYYFLVYQAGAGSGPSAQAVMEQAEVDDDPEVETPSPTLASPAVGSSPPAATGTQTRNDSATQDAEGHDAGVDADVPTDTQPATDATNTAPAALEADPRETATARAHTLFEQGLRLVREDNASLGLVYLRQAFELAHRPGVLINLAAAAAQTGGSLEAARAYTRYLTMDGDGVTRRARRSARRALRALRREVAFVRFTAPDAPNAFIQLNDEPLEAWAAGVDYPVAPGAQKLSYAVDGRVLGIALATVRRGQRVVLTFAPPE